MKTIDIIFDGPPSHESGRFVEVERDGKSINAGEWVELPGGLWALRIPDFESQLASARAALEKAEAEWDAALDKVSAERDQANGALLVMRAALEKSPEHDDLCASLYGEGFKCTCDWAIQRREALTNTASAAEAVTEALVNGMVDRFCGWPLPEDFGPDCGITFKQDYNENTPWPQKHHPTGTNLFTATQAKAMFIYCLNRADGKETK